MWSKQLDSEKHRDAVALLRSVLAAPAGNSRSTSQPITSDLPPEQLAQLLHDRENFIWLDGASTRQMFFHNPLAVISGNGREATAKGPLGNVEFAASSIDLLQAALDAWVGPSGAMLVGFIGYDIAGELEDIGLESMAPVEFPRLHFALYDLAIIADRHGWSVAGTDAWRGHDGLPFEVPDLIDLLQRAATIAFDEDTGRPLSSGPLSSRPDKHGFTDSVDRLVNRIHHGDFFQTNLCRHLSAPFPSDRSWNLYQRMRKASPSNYGAYVNLKKGQTLLSMSPELFLRVEGNSVETCPIKGTRQRGETGEEDAALQNDLLTSSKDQAELAMIVDVARNDLSRVCATGSVQVPEHATLLTLPTLHHTFSRVTGQLRHDVGLTDLLRASFPPASITGAPKIAAMQASLREEQSGRGPCMGSIGWLSLDGRLELSVAIRTAYTNAQNIYYLAGCGITVESNARAEFEESQAKARAFCEALEWGAVEFAPRNKPMSGAQ